MRVGAVVVNYRSVDETVECVRSLVGEGVGDIVVVDNDAEGDCTTALVSFGSCVSVIVPGVNLGYGAAVNRGVAALPDAVVDVVVCNPDLQFTPGSVTALFSSLEPDPRVAIVGPRLLYPDGTPYPSARRFPDPVTAGAHALIGFFAKGNRFTRRYRMEESDLERRTPVDWVSGACMFVRRRVFEALGGFDESYFMYLEDVDLCRRVCEAGYLVVFDPAAEVVHAQGSSTASRPLSMVVEHHRSALRYAVRTLRGWRRALVPAAAAVLCVRGTAALGGQVLRSARSRRSPTERAS